LVSVPAVRRSARCPLPSGRLTLFPYALLDYPQTPALLEAALSCFLVRGLHATSTNEVAAAAGISHGRLYRTFGDKPQLLQAVYAYAIAQLRAPLTQGGWAALPEEHLPQQLFRWWHLTARAAMSHQNAFAFWHLYRASAASFWAPPLGPFADVPAYVSQTLTPALRARLSLQAVSPQLLAALLVAQWTAVVMVVLTDMSCRSQPALRTRLLTQAYASWWQSLDLPADMPPLILEAAAPD
jgi:AcrR family transcriptional regulator